MVSIIILAAGEGKRMRSPLPKVLHTVGGRSLLGHVIITAAQLSPESITLVLSPLLQNWIPDTQIEVQYAIQEIPLGTGDAVKIGLSHNTIKSSDTMILYGDTPLLRAETLQTALNTYYQRSHPHLLLIGMRVHSPNQYGRLVCDQDGRVEKIIEHQEATPEEQALTFCNSGIIIAPTPLLRDLVGELSPHNQAQEYYLTDIIRMAKQRGIPSHVMEGPVEEFGGINTQEELSHAEFILQQKWRQQFMQQGVTLRNPATTFFQFDTFIEPGVVIAPFVVFGMGVHIKKSAQILSYCHIEHTLIQENAIIGPFAHLRNGCQIGKEAIVGNFVELKNVRLDSKAKIKHLSYMGDAIIGRQTNIGAGTITCNYDGYHKATTTIGEEVFIGSNTALVAPLIIEDHAIVAAGSVITEDVPKQALAIARERQVNKPEWAKQFAHRQQRSS